MKSAQLLAMDFEDSLTFDPDDASQMWGLIGDIKQMPLRLCISKIWIETMAYQSSK